MNTISSSASSLERAARCWHEGRVDAAEAHLSAALEAEPENAAAHGLLGEVLLALGRPQEAWRSFERADARRAPAPAVLAARAELCLSLSYAEQALGLFDRALAAVPALAAARRGRIRALLDLDDAAAALMACDTLDGAPPPTAWRALALSKLDRPQEALRCAAQACREDPGDPHALLALGSAKLLCGLAAEGLAAFEQALCLEPLLAQAHAGRGLALAALGRGTDAVSAYAHAAHLRPRDAALYLEVGLLMMRLGYAANAYAAFSTVLDLKPNDVRALEGAAFALMALNRHEEALPRFTLLLAAAPLTNYLLGGKFFAQLHCCDWSEYAQVSRAIAQSVATGARVATPLSFIAHNDSPAAQRRCAEIYSADHCAVKTRLPQRAVHAAGPRLRIGYLSADLRAHPVAQLLAGVFESHDRSRFETYAFSASGDDGSPLRRRLEHGFDQFVDVNALQDAAIAARMAELSIDIAVDLGGHTQGSRTRVLAHRPAPLQVAFLGFPGSSGADFIDYIIADRQVIPEADQEHYREKVVYLPDSYLPNDFAFAAPAPPTREQAGLPATGVVFCSFNAPYKLSPLIFDSWMRILTAVPDSILWLREASAIAQRNLAQEAARRGVDPARLLYAPRVDDTAAHYARLSLADLFLDTHPYNAHTTASDALGAGVPVITLRGRSFASRVATSLLHAAGLPQLSVDSEHRYEQLAVTLARSPSALLKLKTQLRAARAVAPLFDTRRFCWHLEAAYVAMAARQQRGEAPAALWVPNEPGPPVALKCS